MHNLVSRLNNVSAFLSSCLMALLVAISLSSFLFTADPKGELTISSVKVCVFLVSQREFMVDFLSSVFHLKPAVTLIKSKNSHLFSSIFQQVSRLLCFEIYFVILKSTDLSPLFHWNTKQLFLYLEAEYENAQGVSVIQWLLSSLTNSRSR